MFKWFTELTKKEKKTFWACFSGWGLDAMDTQMYVLTIPTLIAVWGMSKGEAGLLGTAVLIMSSFGGWIAGMLSDRFGRVRVLQLTIVWFSAFTFLSGFTNSFEQLLITRSLQGLGFGGEWAVGAVLISETINAKVRGRVVGAIQAGWACGNEMERSLNRSAEKAGVTAKENKTVNTMDRRMRDGIGGLL